MTLSLIQVWSPPRVVGGGTRSIISAGGDFIPRDDRLLLGFGTFLLIQDKRGFSGHCAGVEIELQAGYRWAHRGEAAAAATATATAV